MLDTAERVPEVESTRPLARSEKIYEPLEALEVVCKVRLLPAAVPPIMVCPPASPVMRSLVMVLVARVRPLLKVRAFSLVLKVSQSVSDRAPMVEVEASPKDTT